ncbi:hypothetical protein BC833DRAFT_420899, partial [Globomyces pollinis-pini]
IISNLIKQNKILKIIGLDFINPTESNLAYFIESLKVNTTLSVVDLYYAHTIKNSLRQAMRSILTINPSFRINYYGCDTTVYKQFETQKIHFNSQAAKMLTYRPFYILLTHVFPIELVELMLHLYTSTLVVDHHMLTMVLLNRKSIGKLIDQDVTFSYGELIRNCARWNLIRKSLL